MKKILSVFLAALLLAGLLTGCGGSRNAEPAPAATEAPAATGTPAATEAPADDTPANVASGADTIEYEDVVEEGMVPVSAEFIRDGVYDVAMNSSSAMFKADHVKLVVADGQMQAVLYMSSEAYPYMYAGTAAQAAKADESEYIALEPSDEEGFNRFVLPVAALDDGEDFAAYSKRKELWYDRTLLFRADSLPLDAFADGYLTTPESLGLADGEYTVEVELSGGSGKASVHSPARLFVEGGKAAAEIIWGSSNYDFMVVGGEHIDPETLEGGSTFRIPVTVFDHPIAVQADTVAMSTPHLIDYALIFSSASIE